MRGEVAALTRPGVAIGLRLAGLLPLEVIEPEAAIASIEDLMREDVAVVLVEEALWDALPRELRDRIEARPQPLVLPFPSPGPETPAERAEAYLVEMLRRAVGYRVRLH